MQLTQYQKDMLEGVYGHGASMAMQIQTAIGESFEAKRMVPITRAHVSLSAQPADVWFSGKMLSAGARCRVRPTVNPGYSLKYFQSRNLIDSTAVANMEKTEQIYRELGAVLTYSCTPYLFGNVPRFGEICALSETSVTIYANSVLGARTNRESAASAMCAAITGFVPEYGMLLPENRRATVLVQVEARIRTPFDWSRLGLTGKKIGRGIPVFIGPGLPEQVTTDCLINLGAQLNVSGSYDMFHIPGVTPEAPTLEAALGGKAPERTVVITEKDLEEALEIYSMPPTKKIDYCILGCPHYSLDQVLTVAEHLKEHPAAVPVYILTSAAVVDYMERYGWKAELEACGGELIPDTCVDEACCFEHLQGKHGVTDSPKGLYYMGCWGIHMTVRDQATCLAWAAAGESVGETASVEFDCTVTKEANYEGISGSDCEAISESGCEGISASGCKAIIEVTDEVDHETIGKADCESMSNFSKSICKTLYHCRQVSSGIARGPVLFSTDPILFYHVDPKTGIVTEKGHCLEGQCIAGRILAFPGGKGSSVVQADGMYRLEENKTAPAGMLVEYLDTVLVSSAVIMEVPMAWKLEESFYKNIKDGDILEMDTNAGIVRICEERE